MELPKKYITRVYILLLAILVFSSGVFIAVAYQSPTQLPPGGNVTPPLNTGPQNQTKGGDITARNFISTNQIVVGGTGNNALVIPSGGVTIGQGSQNLVINPNSRGEVLLQSTTAGATNNLRIRADGKAILLQPSSGNVGIGLGGAPTAKLEVGGGGNQTVDLRVYGRIQTGDGSNNGGVWLDATQTGFVGTYGAGNQIGFWLGGGIGWGAFNINRTTGNVAIGMPASASEKLQVNGNVRATGFCIGTDCIASWPAGGGGTVGGSGTFGTIPLWQFGGTSLGDSGITQGGGYIIFNPTLNVRARGFELRSVGGVNYVDVATLNILPGNTLRYNGQPAMLFGGTYTLNAAGNCLYGNPLATNNCTCTPGFNPYIMFNYNGTNGDRTLYGCYR